ncbi:MAG: hypothetical protein HC880_13025, partial [Bacteroidia bacterium]|nr:hypothetical protein [Bacteroidia bacterium]
MKHNQVIIFVLSLLTITAQSSAQTTETLLDHFDEPSSLWSAQGNSTAQASVENGFYVLRHNQTQRYATFSRPTALPSEGNFYLETRFRINNASPQSSFGLLWGFPELNTFYCLNGFEQAFNIFEFQNGSYRELQPTESEGHLLASGQWNTLGIRRDESGLTFYANGHSS